MVDISTDSLKMLCEALFSKYWQALRCFEKDQAYKIFEDCQSTVPAPSLFM